MDDVFRALADPTRRRLLDALYKKDGQTLGALERCVRRSGAGRRASAPRRHSGRPQPLSKGASKELGGVQGSPPSRTMTRFGVMKHLRVLEQARLVVTKRRGREKLHFLNPVPIRLVHDRWVSKYAEPWAAALSDLKHSLENKTVEKRTMEKVFEIYIKTSPERLWEAITNPAMRSKYTFGVEVHSDWKRGSRYEGRAGSETTSPSMPILAGENLEVDPPHRLVQSFNALWSDDVKREGTSRVTWEIEKIEDSCRLTVTHDQLREKANPELYGGWPMILSGLKTLLETGQTLTTPGSLRYSQAPKTTA